MRAACAAATSGTAYPAWRPSSPTGCRSRQGAHCAVLEANAGSIAGRAHRRPPRRALTAGTVKNSFRGIHSARCARLRIPIRLQRRGGRKLIMTPEGAAAPASKPRRDETLIKAACARAPLAPQDRERAGQGRSPTLRSRRASRTRMSAVSYSWPALPRTSRRRSSMGGSRRG